MIAKPSFEMPWMPKECPRESWWAIRIMPAKSFASNARKMGIGQRTVLSPHWDPVVSTKAPVTTPGAGELTAHSPTEEVSQNSVTVQKEKLMKTDGAQDLPHYPCPGTSFITIIGVLGNSGCVGHPNLVSFWYRDKLLCPYCLCRKSFIRIHRRYGNGRKATKKIIYSSFDLSIWETNLPIRIASSTQLPSPLVGRGYYS